MCRMADSVLKIAGASYHGGFSHVDDFGANLGTLLLDDDVVAIRDEQQTLTRNSKGTFEICRTRAIASVEVTSEQVAKSKLGPAIFFGVLGAAGAKATQDRATMLVTLKNGETGYFTVEAKSTAKVLGIISPWIRAHGIAMGPGEPPQPAAAPPSIADELAKLADLRDSECSARRSFLR